MKLTRRRLRKMILSVISEATIKPNIPYADDEQYAKILKLSRSTDLMDRREADQYADALGFDPEDVPSLKSRDYNELVDDPTDPYMDLEGFSNQMKRYDANLPKEYAQADDVMGQYEEQSDDPIGDYFDSVNF